MCKTYKIQVVLYHKMSQIETANFLHFVFLLTYLIANLNSTLIWNLNLQILFPAIMEFNLSKLSVKILSINMAIFSQQEGSAYE